MEDLTFPPRHRIATEGFGAKAQCYQIDAIKMTGMRGPNELKEN